MKYLLLVLYRIRSSTSTILYSPFKYNRTPYLPKLFCIGLLFYSFIYEIQSYIMRKYCLTNKICWKFNIMINNCSYCANSSIKRLITSEYFRWLQFFFKYSWTHTYFSDTFPNFAILFKWRIDTFHYFIFVVLLSSVKFHFFMNVFIPDIKL